MYRKIFLKIFKVCESVVKTILMVITMCLALVLALTVWMIKQTNFKKDMHCTVKICLFDFMASNPSKGDKLKTD